MNYRENYLKSISFTYFSLHVIHSKKYFMHTFSLLTSSDIDTVLVFDEYFQIYLPRRQEIERAISDNVCYLMKSDDHIVWYGIFRPYGLLSEGFIELLIIHSKLRWKWYGEWFIKYCEMISQTKRIHTSTNLSNIPMQNLLKKLGYTEWWRLSNFDPDDPEIFYYRKLE